MSCCFWLAVVARVCLCLHAFCYSVLSLCLNQKNIKTTNNRLFSNIGFDFAFTEPSSCQTGCSLYFHIDSRCLRYLPRMASVGKCARCEKTVYQLEAITVGPPRNVEVFHKSCFKCSQPGCTWPLNVSNYKYTNDKVWCGPHNPTSGASYGAHEQNSLDITAQSVQNALSTKISVLV
ncbi:hypothetical protein, variant [Capsaspora owczarzaki ATCC 30864]|uniref:LIM zinc-binding domain-containing protein n=1 Tax=Capsaspora owczarzaki (strain ATCC 30864) TaxID=595528 RepID=A0A0D2WYQ6_CAPO3|nr:hypothetical protein, variant [Capsaspora owczarzaki ATCC 30864]